MNKDIDKTIERQINSIDINIKMSQIMIQNYKNKKLSGFELLAILRGYGITPNLKLTRNNKKIVSSLKTAYNSLNKYIKYTANNKANVVEKFPIKNSKYHVNCFNIDSRTAYEIRDDFTFGNPHKYNQKSKMTGHNKKNWTYGDAYEKLLDKKKSCKKVNIMYRFIWFSDWKKCIRCIKKIQKNFRKRQKIKGKGKGKIKKSIKIKKNKK